MDGADALGALREIGLDAHRAAPILGGWAFWTFDVDGEWIARFARNRDIARAAERELALLPALAEHVSFAIPVPTYAGTRAGLPFFAYRRIPGRGMRRDDATPDLLRALGRMLDELHAFPVDDAARLLGTGPPAGAWRAQYERLAPVVESTVLPELDRALAARVETEFGHLLAAIDGVAPCLVHNDLGLEHVLVNDGDDQPVGIIDFESAWIGDPAADLVGIDLTLGRESAELVAGGAIASDTAERIWHYEWMGSVHALIHAVRTDDRTLLDDARAELARRINRVSRTGRAARA